MRVIVTGGTGLVGRPLVEGLLKKGHEVYVLGNVHVPELEKKGAKFLMHNVANEYAVSHAIEQARPDAVYHLAASLDEHDPNLFKVNVRGTRNVLLGCGLANKKHKLKLFVFPSSIGILSGEEQPLIENAKYDPKTRYERSKMEAELFVLTSRLPYCVVRSTILIGPNAQWASIARAAKKSHPIIGRGDNYWHLADYRDFVELLLLLPSKAAKARSQVFNFAGPDALTYKSLYGVLRKVLKVKREPSHVPVHHALALAQLYEGYCFLLGKKPKVTKSVASIKRLVWERSVDISKLKKVLGFVPKHSTRESLEHALKELKKQGKV